MPGRAVSPFGEQVLSQGVPRTGTGDRSCRAISVALSLSFLVSLYQVQMFALVLFPLCHFLARNFSELKISKFQSWFRSTSHEKPFLT